MIIKVKDKEFSFDGYVNPISVVQKLAEECYDQGRADAIDECIDVLNNSIPLVDNMDVIFGFKCAVERLEQLKEQK